MLQIPLSGRLGHGLFALVDDEDAARVAAFRWRCHAVRSRDEIVKRYAVTGDRHRRVFMHNLLCAAAAGKTVDHVNGDGLDNRRANLRPATRLEQQRNRAPLRHYKGNPRPTPFKGVRRRKSQRLPWSAVITVNGKRIRLGNFTTDGEAAQAYDQAARQYFGAFARINAA